MTITHQIAAAAAFGFQNVAIEQMRQISARSLSTVNINGGGSDGAPINSAMLPKPMTRLKQMATMAQRDFT